MRYGFALVLLISGLSSASLAADGELHTFHCLLGCPLGAPATNDVVVREIYTLSSNDLTRLADWVAYRITPQTIGPSGHRNWQTDPWLGPDETLTESDYEDASETLHVDRGHQAPLAAFSGSDFAYETNILSNITPQASALNQGPWQRLEGRERSLSQATNTAVYVYTGPLFERLMRALPNASGMHRVPSGYWKVVATADGRMTAFIFDQNTPRADDYCDHRVSLMDVELRSRLRLFPMRGAIPFTSLDADLGCATPAPPSAAPAEITTR